MLKFCKERHNEERSKKKKKKEEVKCKLKFCPDQIMSNATTGITYFGQLSYLQGQISHDHTITRMF